MKMRTTKAQDRTLLRLEKRGYDFSHHNEAGEPVLVLREKRIWVRVNRKGGYQP